MVLRKRVYFFSSCGSSRRIDIDDIKELTCFRNKVFGSRRFVNYVVSAQQQVVMFGDFQQRAVGVYTVKPGNPFAEKICVDTETSGKICADQIIFTRQVVHELTLENRGS